MNPTTQLLLIKIVQLGVMLAAGQRFIVFVETCSHVYSVTVRIYTADSVWRTGSPEATLVAQAHVRWQPYAWQKTTAEKHASALTDIQQQLAFMHAALHAYLPYAPALHTEAAA